MQGLPAICALPQCVFLGADLPQIFNVWLEPEVEISVTTTPTRVVLKAENCRIK
jgi:hypothetical protein